MKAHIENPMDDREAILGYWKLVGCVQDERQLSSCDIGSIFQFTPTHFIHVRTGVSFEYDLDPDRTPKAIDKFVSRRDNMVIEGIYELSGDELRVLFHSSHAGDEQARPSAMAGLLGDPHRFVAVYQRSRWRPWRDRIQKGATPLCKPGSLIPKALLKGSGKNK